MVNHSSDLDDTDHSSLEVDIDGPVPVQLPASTVGVSDRDQQAARDLLSLRHAGADGRHQSSSVAGSSSQQTNTPSLSSVLSVQPTNFVTQVPAQLMAAPQLVTTNFRHPNVVNNQVIVQNIGMGRVAGINQGVMLNQFLRQNGRDAGSIQNVTLEQMRLKSELRASGHMTMKARACIRVYRCMPFVIPFISKHFSLRPSPNQYPNQPPLPRNTSQHA